MNDQGDVVGWGYLIHGDTKYTLNSLIPPGTGWDLIYAMSINEAGQIVGAGLFNGGSATHAFLLTPVPEPSVTASLLIFQLISWRRKRFRI
jgi:hypothetical protein